MSLARRTFLKAFAASAGAGFALSGGPSHASVKKAPDALGPITGEVTPITVAERQGRVAKAQDLMKRQGLQALLLEPGSAMFYFTGIEWRRSERLTAVVIPVAGDIAVVTPYFEEPSVRESMAVGQDVRTWYEHENPFERVAEILNDRGLKDGKFGMEETVRHFVSSGVRTAAPAFEVVSGHPVTLGCRMYKSAAEIALMKKANEVTLRAYDYVYRGLEAGMTPAEVTGMMGDAQSALGGAGIWNSALFGQASAYPHGTNQPQEIREGDVVLMDCGCTVEGYQSDISRTFVFGEPTPDQRKVWQTVRQGQRIAFETAQVGTPAGAVDDKVRQYYESLGYGPGYRTPGLSHRTGHGIGLDLHESVNFVHGEETPLAPGMCFSNEPGIYDFEKFGVRLEDCLYLTREGPAWFTVPPDSLDDPIGAVA